MQHPNSPEYQPPTVDDMQLASLSLFAIGVGAFAIASETTPSVIAETSAEFAAFTVGAAVCIDLGRRAFRLFAS